MHPKIKGTTAPTAGINNKLINPGSEYFDAGEEIKARREDEHTSSPIISQKKKNMIPWKKVRLNSL
jgi:hypothetical protein